MTKTSIKRLWTTAKRMFLLSLGVVAVLCGALVGLFVLAFPSTRRPKEDQLLERFYAHRGACERLRDMLEADETLVEVTSSSVETTSGYRGLSGGNFPIGRRSQYLDLLKQTGARYASRSEGKHPDQICIGMWAGGWAGDTRHIELCWLDREPANQVLHLGDYYKSASGARGAFRHIDERWYLWADW